MIDAIHLVVLGCVITIAALLYRRYLRLGAQTVGYSTPLTQRFKTVDAYDACLRNWGKTGAPFAVPQELLPIHQSVLRIVDAYQAIRFHELVSVFDRDLLLAQYENPDFAQIGEWGDGSPVLIRCRSEDSRIYIEDIEECLPGQPRVLADSFEAYLYAAYQDYLASDDR